MARTIKSDWSEGCWCDLGQRFLSGAGFLKLLFHLELFWGFQRVGLELPVELLINFVLLIEEFDTEIIMMAELSNRLLDLFVEADKNHRSRCLTWSFLSWGQVLNRHQSLPKKLELVRSGISVLIRELSYECIESSFLLKLLLALAVGLVFGWDHSDLFLKQ